MLKLDMYGYVESRDAAHNGAFYAIALKLNKIKALPEIIMYPVINTLFRNITFQYKHPTYKWSNCEDFRKTLYKLSGFDYRCGNNNDQLEPALLYFLLTGQIWNVWRILIGYVLRFGIACNFQEFLKPTLLNIGFRALRLKPIYWLLDMQFYFKTILELRIPINKSTTRKIRLFLFLIVIEETDQSTYWTKKLINNIGWDYFIDCLEEYWKPESEKYEIVTLFKKYVDKLK